MVMEALTYDEMRPGCYERDARVKDFELNWVDGSLPFPTFPRFCGQTFYEANDKELGARLRQGVQRLDGRGVVRAVGRREHPAVPHPAVGRRPRGAGGPAQRGEGLPRDLLQRAPPPPEAPDDPQRRVGPALAACNDHGVTLCMHIGSSSTNPAASPDAPGGVGGTLAFNNSMASLADWLFSGKLIEYPEAEARVLRRPDRLDPVHARAGRHGVGPARQLAALQGAASPSRPRPTTTAASSGASPPTATGSRRSPRSVRTTSASRPTTRTRTRRGRTPRSTPTKMLAEFDETVAYKVLRGNAINMLELDRV